MKELIAVSSSMFAGQQVNTVSARELHQFLEQKQDFSSWYKYQIERARLVEGRDFVSCEVFPKKGENPKGGRPTKEYHLTIEAAKHISMMSGTDKGFQVRDYFIECERLAKERSVDPLQYLNDPAAMRGLLLSYTEKVLALEEEKRELLPKADALDRISGADGMNCITDAAKILQVRPKFLFEYLHANHWIYRRTGGKGWVAYQDKIMQGLLTHKVTTVMDIHTGLERVIEHVLVTPKGLAKLATKIQGVAA